MTQERLGISNNVKLIDVYEISEIMGMNLAYFIILV